MRMGFYELKRKVLIGIFAAVAGALLLLAPSVGQVLAEPVRVGVFPNLHCALIYLADSQGYFKKHGIDVVINAQESGLVAINELIADKIDIAPTAEFAFVLQAFKHPDLRIAATIYDGSDHDLIVRKDRAIARPQDLKGKRVAVTQNSSGEFFLYNYLIFNRIPAGSIHVVYLTPYEIVKAMAGGSVDAALSWPPYTTQMVKQLGAKVAVWPAQSGQEWYVVLLAKEGFLKTQPKTMEQFLAALSDAEGFIDEISGPCASCPAQHIENGCRDIPPRLVRVTFSAPVDPGPARPHGAGGKVGDAQQSGRKGRDAQLSRLSQLWRP